MIPPRRMPPGILQLVEILPDKTKVIIQELPTSSKNRDKINQICNDLLMVNPKRDLFTTENHAHL